MDFVWQTCFPELSYQFFILWWLRWSVLELVDANCTSVNFESLTHCLHSRKLLRLLWAWRGMLVEPAPSSPASARRPAPSSFLSFQSQWHMAWHTNAPVALCETKGSRQDFPLFPVGKEGLVKASTPDHSKGENDWTNAKSKSAWKSSGDFFKSSATKPASSTPLWIFIRPALYSVRWPPPKQTTADTQALKSSDILWMPSCRKQEKPEQSVHIFHVIVWMPNCMSCPRWIASGKLYWKVRWRKVNRFLGKKTRVCEWQPQHRDAPFHHAEKYSVAHWTHKTSSVSTHQVPNKKKISKQHWLNSTINSWHRASDLILSNFFQLFCDNMQGHAFKPIPSVICMDPESFRNHV